MSLLKAIVRLLLVATLVLMGRGRLVVVVSAAVAANSIVVIEENVSSPRRSSSIRYRSVAIAAARSMASDLVRFSPGMNVLSG